MKTIKIRIKDNKVKPYIVEKVYEYRHFENMYIILLHQDYNQNLNDFKVLTDYKVMRAVLTDNNDDINRLFRLYKVLLYYPLSLSLLFSSRNSFINRFALFARLPCNLQLNTVTI